MPLHRLNSPLAQALSKIRNPRLLIAFLEDLLSPAEYRALERRWALIKLLHKKIPQRLIARRLRLGIATVTRGARELNNPAGGFTKVLRYLKNH